MLKILFYILALLIGEYVIAQDYFAVVVKNANTTYNYPEFAEFTLIHESGSQTILEKNESLTLEGDYTLSIKTFWKSSPEIFKK